MPTFRFNLKEQDCPLCKAELSSLRQENERLRDALGRLVEVAKTYGIFMAGVTPLNVLRSEDMQSEHKSFADSIQSARQALTKEG